jgi:hypothetical protein
MSIIPATWKIEAGGSRFLKPAQAKIVKPCFKDKIKTKGLGCA